MSIVSSIQLRDYQAALIRGVHNCMRDGHRRILTVLPTAGGKRYVAVHWSQVAAARNREVLVVTDRRLLVDQMVNELDNFGIGCGIIMSGYEENRQPRVQVASLQTLASRYLETGEGLPPANLLIVDEAHRSPDLYAKLFARYPDAYVVGLTATPVGPQGKTLIPLYDVMFEGTSNSQLIRRGMLLPTRVYAPSEPDMSKIKINCGAEYHQAQLSKRVKEVTLFGNIFHEWTSVANRKTVVFAPGVAYCYGLRGGPGLPGESFYTHGIRAEVIEARTPTDERRRIIDDLEHGDLQVLISVDVIKEGFDAPIVSCGIDLQPNAQLRTYWQKIGRIKRAFEGQSEAIWIDMAGNSWNFPHPDDDPLWAEVTGDIDTQEAIRKRNDPKPIVCPKCSLQRKSGAVCPECGHKCEQRIKRVRMGNGKLREVSAEQLKKREKTEIEKRADWWKSELFAGVNAGKTLKQCKVSYFRRRGEWPPHRLPCMPDAGSAMWSRLVADVYAPSYICEQFKRSES